MANSRFAVDAVRRRRGGADAGPGGDTDGPGTAARDGVTNACVHLKALGHCAGSTALPDERGIAPDEGVIPNETFAKAAASRCWTHELKIRDLA